MSDNCIFCKIVKGEIPSKKVYEDDSSLGFVDLYPQAKLHYLFISKVHTKNISEMVTDEKSMINVFNAITKFTKESNLFSDGFRVVTNSGKHAGQTVFHTHFHVLGGEQLSHFGS
jgi:histidine triad (HIT) family protein